jgi:hypothetical protein
MDEDNDELDLTEDKQTVDNETEEKKPDDVSFDLYMNLCLR